MKPFLLALLLTGSGLPALAGPGPQAPTQPARLELPLGAFTSDVQLQPLLADSSLVLLVEQEVPGKARNGVSFQKYDRQLKPQWTTPLDVPLDFDFARLTAEGTMIYALYQSQYALNKLWVAELDGRTGAVRTYTFDTKTSRNIYEYKALGGNLFLTVLVDNHLTALLLDLRTDKSRFLPSVYEEIPTNLTMLADSATRRAEFVMSQTNGLKSRLLLKQLSADGQLLHSEYVQAESERSLLSAQLNPGDGDSDGRVLTGTYTLRDTRYSQGLFVADLTENTTAVNGHRPLRFYDFLNLKHFFDFMSPSRVARLRVRGAKMRAAAHDLRLHYRLLIHDLMPTPQGYVLTAEIYYPRYRNNAMGSTYYSPFLGSYNTVAARPNRNFDGYYTTHAIVCGFDRRGNLLWDNTFVMRNTESYDLNENVQLRPLPDGRYVMAYLDDYRIRYKIIDGSTTSSNDLEVPIQTTLSEAKEKANNATQQGLVAWYGSRFLAYGYQHVRTGLGAGRDVYFINAVAFEGAM